MVILLFFGLLSEILGQHSGFGAFLVGLALPGGPPLGTTITQKLETISNVLLLPVFLAASGLRMRLASTGGPPSLVFTELIIMMGYVGKFCGTLVSAHLCGMPLWEAIPLSIIMCCKGIIEVAVYTLWYDRKVLFRTTCILKNGCLYGRLAVQSFSYTSHL